MSTINKKPYINTVLESLTPEEKATLKSLINGEGDAPVFRSILPYGSPKLTASDKGIKRVDLEVSTLLASNVYRGYLIYNDSLCVLIVYYSFKNQGLKLIKLELGNDGFWEYNLKPCELGIVELRSELDDAGDIDPVDLTHYAKIHNYEEGIVLTEAILADVKSGDIIKMANLEFVVNNKVNQTPRSITGKCIGQIIGDSITIYELDWEIGEELEPITKKLDVSDEFDRDVTIQVATSGDSTKA